MDIIVRTPGPLTTVQDAGRRGWRHLGVALAGAMDTQAATLANALVGNAVDAAVIEFTLQGPTLELNLPTRIAVVGAEVDMRYEAPDGTWHRLQSNRLVELPAGLLRLGAVRGQTRAWLAIAGGIATPPVLGSRSTDVRSGFGGHHGRALAKHDVLALGPAPRVDVGVPRMQAWWLNPVHGARFDAPVRFVPTAHAAAPMLARRTWRVSPRSNRQGARLEGTPLPTGSGNEVSTAVAPGTIQLPPDGQPIVLLAEAQTTGGYPRLGHVIAADLARFAQRLPGDPVYFQPCSADEAIALLRSSHMTQQRLIHAIRARVG